jgi:hypothetical protein
MPATSVAGPLSRAGACRSAHSRPLGRRRMPRRRMPGRRMPGGPGRAPPPGAVEVWPSVTPFGEAGRISVSIIVLAFLCSSAGSTFASPRERQLRQRYPLGQRRAAGPPAPPRPQPVHRWWLNPTPSRNQAPRRRYRSAVDAALGCHHMRSSATPPVASVTPNLLLLEIRRAFAAYSLPSHSPASLGRRACSLACRPRPTAVPPPWDAAPTKAGPGTARRAESWCARFRVQCGGPAR